MTTIEANPYSWPWDGDLAPARLAVVVAGAQRYWAARALGVDVTLGAVAPSSALLAAVRA